MFVQLCVIDPSRSELPSRHDTFRFCSDRNLTYRTLSDFLDTAIWILKSSLYLHVFCVFLPHCLLHSLLLHPSLSLWLCMNTIVSSEARLFSLPSCFSSVFPSRNTWISANPKAGYNVTSCNAMVSSIHEACFWISDNKEALPLPCELTYQGFVVSMLSNSLRTGKFIPRFSHRRHRYRATLQSVTSFCRGSRTFDDWVCMASGVRDFWKK